MTVLKITRSAFGGEGIASHEGKTCFVQGALPGETVEAEAIQEKKNFSRYKILRVVEPSPHRVEPPCRHYGYCGGCQYQHVSYAEERHFKETQVQEILKRLAGVETPVQPMIYAEKEYGYRNSVSFRVVKSPKSKRSVLSFIASDNVSTVAVKHCDILDRRFDPVVEAQHFLKDKVEKIGFKLAENGEIIPDQEQRFFRVKLNGEPIIAHSMGFFQTNLRVTELLADQVKEWVESVQPQAFFDLFAGVGTFSWLCAKNVPKIFCVEESPYGIAALRMNREEKHVDSLEVVPGRVEKEFPLLWQRAGAKDAAILVDPPRQGLDKGLAQHLSALTGAKALIYISCDIPTLARDLKIILSQGRFTLSQLVPFDMFPRTKHIEAAALLLSC